MLFVGSCFADEMGKRFSDELFRTMVNPFGVMYNPASILHTVDRLLAGERPEGDDKGEFVTPVQNAMLCDGERFIGRLPEFTLRGTIYDMYGKSFIGVSSDKPIFNDKTILMKMDYSK